MKKITTLFLGLAFALTACDKQDNSTPNGDEANYSISIGVNNGVQTRADSEFPNTDLAATHTARYIVEIYHDNVLYKRINQSSNVAEFRLVTNQAYDFLVWVDYVLKDAPLADLHYNTESLKTVSMIGDYTNNDHSRDAFFYYLRKEKEDIGNQTNSFNITCKRPFGQLNVTTTDWNFTKNITEITPTTVLTSFTGYNTFNVYTGEASNKVAITYKAPLALAGSVVGNSCKFTCDYIFAPKEGQYIIPDTRIKLYNSEKAEITNTDNMLINLPIQRNYKTSVSGMLMSKTGKVTVDVKADWHDDSPTSLEIEE